MLGAQLASHVPVLDLEFLMGEYTLSLSNDLLRGSQQIERIYQDVSLGAGVVARLGARWSLKCISVLKRIMKSAQQCTNSRK